MYIKGQSIYTALVTHITSIVKAIVQVLLEEVFKPAAAAVFRGTGELLVVMFPKQNLQFDNNLTMRFWKSKVTYLISVRHH